MEVKELLTESMVYIEKHMEFVEWVRSYDTAGGDIRSVTLHEECQEESFSED